MKVVKIESVASDARGSISDILSDTPIEHVTVINSTAGSVRGNHYHKETLQWVYLHSGKIESVTQKPGEPAMSHMLEPGHLLLTEAMEKHALKAISDSVFFVFTRGPRGGDRYESDTYRLEEKLVE